MFQQVSNILLFCTPLLQKVVRDIFISKSLYSSISISLIHDGRFLDMGTPMPQQNPAIQNFRDFELSKFRESVVRATMHFHQ